MIRNEVIDTLMNRRSVRKYKPEKPSREVIETIVRAGQQAPFASQLYSLIFSTEGKIAFDAPLWFLVCVDAHKLERFMQVRGWKVVTNDLTLLLLGMQDASYMAENMVAAAESLGLGSCFLGEGSMSASRVRRLVKKHRLPRRVLPMVELVMGYPDEDFPPRPRYPLEFTLFEGAYPELSDAAVAGAMKTMDEGYLAQRYYERLKARIRIESGAPETCTYETYGWTEHISRKWGQWSASPDELLNAFEECGFTFEREEKDAVRP